MTCGTGPWEGLPDEQVLLAHVAADLRHRAATTADTADQEQVGWPGEHSQERARNHRPQSLVLRGLGDRRAVPSRVRTVPDVPDQGFGFQGQIHRPVPAQGGTAPRAPRPGRRRPGAQGRGEEARRGRRRGHLPGVDRDARPQLVADGVQDRHGKARPGYWRAGHPRGALGHLRDPPVRQQEAQTVPAQDRAHDRRPAGRPVAVGRPADIGEGAARGYRRDHGGRDGAGREAARRRAAGCPLRSVPCGGSWEAVPPGKPGGGRGRPSPLENTESRTIPADSGTAAGSAAAPATEAGADST
jgi:hypothetical protein